MLWGRRAPAPASQARAEPVLPPIPHRPPMRIRADAAWELSAPLADTSPAYSVPQPPPGTLPAGVTTVSMAMDDALGSLCTWAQGFQYGGSVGPLMFPGYTVLAELTQQPEYRRGSEVIAEEMTRKWIRFTTHGEDKADRIAAISRAMDRFRVQQIFRVAAEHDGFFGAANIHPIIDGADVSRPLVYKPAMVRKGSLQGFNLVEPMWCYPTAFNSTNPLAADFYQPQNWYVQGQPVHVSRLFRIVSRPVPSYLRAQYQFGGLSLTMMAAPYVENFKRTRDAVSALIKSFSTTGLATDMSDVMNAGAATTLVQRVMLFNANRDNRGAYVYDKEKEDIKNVSAPLGGLDALQGQAEEMICGIQGIPIIKWWGDPPSGLNSSPDGVIRCFYDTIHAKQEKDFREPLRRVIDLVQLNEFGDIDPEITFEFEPLWQLSAAEMATVQKTRADTDAIYMQESVLAPEECRQQLIADEASPYHGLEGPAPGPADDVDEDDPPLTLAALMGEGGVEEGASS